MKVVAIEVAEAIENEIANFLKDWGGGYVMRFTRFIDLGGKQTELYLYPPEVGASPWCTINVRSVFKSDEGECMLYSINIPVAGKRFEDVLVSPEIWKLPALTDKILKFLKTDLLLKINEGGATLEGGSNALESSEAAPQGEAALADSTEEEDELEDLDTEGILASDDDDGGAGFDPMDIIAAAQANAEKGDSDDAFDPASVIQAANEESSEGVPADDSEVTESGFNPDDVIKD
ncbi:MAG: hypothetical protein ACI92G_001129 [Candidatus Pelagisphaera sp.]|jgi:hypothetical protein